MPEPQVLALFVNQLLKTVLVEPDDHFVVPDHGRCGRALVGFDEFTSRFLIITDVLFLKLHILLRKKLFRVVTGRSTVGAEHDYVTHLFLQI